MSGEFPGAIPEIPVANVDLAVAYYTTSLGFKLDWGGEENGGIAGISRGACRLFLTGSVFRQMHGNVAPVVIWLNMKSAQEVDEVHAQWLDRKVKIRSRLASQPWKLREFVADDLDGNLLRVFYDFSMDV